MQIQNSQEVRHEVARSIFHAKTLLVFLHTGQQDFTGQFKERRIKVAQQRHGTLNQSLNFIKQAIDPDDFAIGSFRDSVPFADDIGAAVQPPSAERPLPSRWWERNRPRS